MMENNQINEIEEQRKMLKRWMHALEAADIPKSSRFIHKDEFASMIKSTNSSEFADFVFGTGKNDENKIGKWDKGWSDGWSFIIDGQSSNDQYTPSQVRRRVGMSVLQNAITYVCQNNDYFPPYGKYVDYRAFRSALASRDHSYDVVDALSEIHVLFISEIFPQDTRSEVLNDIMKFRFDDLMRRRQDDELVTILSFSRGCRESFQSDMLGEEIQQMLKKCHNHGTGEIEEQRITRIVTCGQGNMQ